MADFLAAILDRGETIPVVKATMASLALSGFEAHRDAPFPAKPLDAPDELVTGHGTTYTCVQNKELAVTFCQAAIQLMSVTDDMSGPCTK